MTGVVVTMALAGTGIMVEAQRLSLTVRLRNDAGVTDAVLKDAKDAVTHVYANAGVTLQWVDARPNITVILLSREKAEKLHQSANTMGFAPGSGTYRSTVAYILMHRVEEVSMGYHAEKTVVLSAAVAHELGHVLLPYNSHSKTGLMRAEWNQSDFRDAKRGKLVFTADQVSQIQQSPVVNRLTTDD